MIICEECDEPIFGPYGKLVEPFLDDDNFPMEQHFCPECFCTLFHGDHVEEEDCKPWCNSMSTSGKVDEHGVRYCNCKLLEDHKDKS